MKNVDYRKNRFRFKKKNLDRYEEVSFESIYYSRYVEKYFSIIPILAVSGIGYFSTEHPKPVTLSFTFGIIPTFALCIAI